MRYSDAASKNSLLLALTLNIPPQPPDLLSSLPRPLPLLASRRIAPHCFLSSCANYSHSFLESLQSSNTKFRLRDSYFRIFNRKQHPEVPRTYFELCDSREIAQPARRVSAQTSPNIKRKDRTLAHSPLGPLLHFGSLLLHFGLLL
jgi:hypothetical protein